MNISSDELYYAIKCVYQNWKDNPEEFQTEVEVLEDVEESASELLKVYQGIVMAQRMQNKENN